MSSPINLRKSRRAQSAPQNGENCTAKKATTTTTGTGKASEPKGRQESGRAASIIVALGSAPQCSTCPTTELGAKHGVGARARARTKAGVGSCSRGRHRHRILAAVVACEKFSALEI